MFNKINYKNKNLITIFIFIMIGFSLIIFISYELSVQKIMRNRDLYIINNLVENNPQIETEIIDTFKNALGTDNSKITDKYFINGEYEFKHKPFSNQTKESIFFLLSCMIIMGFIIFLFQRKVFIDIENKLYKLIHNIDRAMNLDFKKLDEKNEEGAIYLLYTQFNLLSRRYKNTLKKMKENHDSLKDLIYNLSHQLKTPISSIKIFNEIMISEQDYEQKQTEEFLLKSKNQINKIEWIIKKMFEISKIENDEIRLKKEKISIKSLINDIIENYKHIIEKKNIKISITENNNSLILVDKNMIKEALTNIIENALKYSFDNEIVSISIVEKKSKLILSIKDKGIKIKNEGKELFNKFYRSEKAKQINPEGTGLGLAFSKATIEKNNGIIKYISDDLYTEFIVEFQK